MINVLSPLDMTDNPINRALYNLRISEVGSAASITPVLATQDMIDVTALAVGLTVNNPTGTPTNGRRMIMRIRDNGVARSIAWGSAYRSVIDPLPLVTVAGRVMYLGFIHYTTQGTWDLVAYCVQP